MTGEGAIEITPMSAMKKMPPHSQQRPQFAIANPIATGFARNVPIYRNGVRGKRNKTSKFRDIETSIQSNMRNKHDKFHNVYTRLFRLVHKLSSRSHILLLLK